MKRQKTEAIVIHCTATLAHQDFHKAEIDAMHKRRGWKGIGYHYLICLDGKVETGRAADAQGAHVQGFNNRTIGIAYVGGLRSADAKPIDTRTVPQINAMLALCKELSAKYPGTVILGHRDLSPDLDKDGTVEPQEWMKMCPCFDAGQWAAVNGLRGGYYSKGAFYRLANRPVDGFQYLPVSPLSPASLPDPGKTGKWLPDGRFQAAPTGSGASPAPASEPPVIVPNQVVPDLVPQGEYTLPARAQTWREWLESFFR